MGYNQLKKAACMQLTCMHTTWANPIIVGTVTDQSREELTGKQCST